LKYSNKVTDDYLDRLLADLNSNDPEQIKKAELAKQPGDYDASSHELDMIVDIASHVDGIAGASLTGAGFGGNILTITEKDDLLFIESLQQRVNKLFKEGKISRELLFIPANYYYYDDDGIVVNVTVANAEAL